MDKLFLSGLLSRNAGKKEVQHDNESPTPSCTAAPKPYSASALYSNSTGGTGSVALASIGALVSTPYAGRPHEQLLFDAATCDIVILVGDERNYARALPAHKDVLRSRNSGGYFARLLADPNSFTEYSNKATGPGAEVATGALADKPMIRRLHWDWQVASALLSFLYRDSCEVTWGALSELRRLAEEVGARGLCDAVDYLLDPQHLLPWTVADLRAAAVSLKRHQLVDAADAYEAAMRATGVEEAIRMAAVVYHARQARPKISITVPAPSSLSTIDAATQLQGSPSSRSPTSNAYAGGGGSGGGGDSTFLMRSPGSRVGGGGGGVSRSSSFASRSGILPTCLSAPAAAAGSAAANGDGGDGGVGGGYSTSSTTATAVAATGGGSGCGSSCFRDSRVGMDIVDGVLRSVALDSKILRGLLLPGRRRDSVLLCGGGGSGGSGCSTGPSGGSSGGGSGGGWPRRSLQANGPFISATAATAAARRPSSPYRSAAPTAASNGAHTLIPEVRLVSSRLRSAMASANHGNGGGGSGGGGSGSGVIHGSSSSVLMAGSDHLTAGIPFGPSTNRTAATGVGGTDEPSEVSPPLELLVIVPAAQLAPSLASLVQRPLDAHVQAYMGPTTQPQGGPTAAMIVTGLAAATGTTGPNVAAATTIISGSGSSSSSNGLFGGGGGGGGGGLGPNSGGGGAGLRVGKVPELRSASFSTGQLVIPQLSGLPLSFDPFSKLSGLPGLSWGAASDKSGTVPSCNGPNPNNASSGNCATSGTSALSCASLLQQLPTASDSGNFDQISLALALDLQASMSQTSNGLSGSAAATAATTAAANSENVGAGGGGFGAGFSASRLLSCALTTLGAADHPQFIVRMDPTQASQAVAFERRRAGTDPHPLNGISGSLAAPSFGGVGGGSLGVGGAGMATSTLSTAAACTAATNAVKTVLGPANPRDYFIPLPDHPAGAITITVPMGLVLVDSATLEAVSGPLGCGGGGGGGSGANGNGGVGGGFGFRSCTDSGSGPYGTSGGGGGGCCMPGRVAALMPHLLASATALSHVVSAAGMISQILRVAGEQHGLFGVPNLRASLRICNPSTAMLTALAQTNTHFAVASQRENTIYIRKPPADILRLLQALHSTLPTKIVGGNIVGGGLSTGGGGGGGGNGGGESFLRSRISSGDSFTSGAASSRQAVQRRAYCCMEVKRSSTSSGYGNILATAAGGPPSPLVLPPPPPGLLSPTGAATAGTTTSPHPRRTTTSEFNLRPSAHVTTALPYSHGLPYCQLERLFPGLHLHVVELQREGVMLDEF